MRTVSSEHWSPFCAAGVESCCRCSHGLSRYPRSPFLRWDIASIPLVSSAGPHKLGVYWLEPFLLGWDLRVLWFRASSAVVVLRRVGLKRIVDDIWVYLNLNFEI